MVAIATGTPLCRAGLCGGREGLEGTGAGAGAGPKTGKTAAPTSRRDASHAAVPQPCLRSP